jgi:TolB-like protein
MKTFTILSVLLIFLTFTGCASTPDQKQPLQTDFNRSEASMPKNGSVADGTDSATVLTDAIIRHVHKLPNKRLTVADFKEIDGDETEEGKLLAEQIITRLSRVNGLKIVERNQLDVIYEEQKFSLSGNTEEELEVGRILNVDAVVFGTIARLDDVEEINARMIDATSGEIYCAVSHRRKRSQREREFARLPDQQRKRVKQEYHKRQVERKQAPAMYQLKEQRQRQLLQLKRRAPHRYDQVVRTMREIEYLKNHQLNTYLLVTEPPHSPRLNKVRQSNPAYFKQLKGLRKQLGLACQSAPAYREILNLQRHQVFQNMKHNPKRLHRQ